MESFIRGFKFLKQSWQMALADQDLLKPSFYALLAGFLVTLLSLLPMGLMAFFLGDFGLGRALIYISGAVLVFIQFTVSYVFSAMTVYLIYGYLAEGDGKLDKAWEIVKRDKWDIVALSAASTAIKILRDMMSGRKRNVFRDAFANLVGVLWTEATYIVLPVMVIEDLNLRNGLKRAGQIIRDNLLLIGVSTVGVRAVTTVVGILLGGLGVGLGVLAGIALATIVSGSGWVIVLAVVVGVLVATPFVLIAAILNSYTSTAYHTCLYLWARDVERARSTGQDLSIPAPGPLAAVLN